MLPTMSMFAFGGNVGRPDILLASPYRRVAVIFPSMVIVSPMRTSDFTNVDTVFPMMFTFTTFPGTKSAAPVISDALPMR
ncbi:hypothetical protein PBCV1_a033R [Paramecium bursaria Chlorella virus 1]|uniref:Uncharacterized protein n=1 Tax=Paramecium bursaria Chlorella virus 1 TaxID=10506 RepID=Q89368_PBCV1|nr:hypothetical protein PBCV1_a033R [Paramecium bursaria Chlorella virus 1]AAC96401.1 hypothetical protein [Paramecium bursaria Chlorella virus 1]